MPERVVPIHPMPTAGALVQRRELAAVWGRFQLDLRSGVRSLDEQVLALLGDRERQWRQAEWRRSVHPDDRSALPDYESLCAEAPASTFRSVRMRLRRADGSWLVFDEWIEAYSCDADGRVVAVEGLLIDVTAAEREQESLRSAAKRIYSALRVSGDGWWDWNLPEATFAISSSWLTKLDIEPPQPMLGLEAWLSLAHEDDRTRIAKHIGQHLTGAVNQVDVHFRALTRRGEVRWVQARGAVVSRQPNAGPSRLIGTFVDRTEMVLAEQEQRLLVERYELAADVAGLGLFRYEWGEDRWEWDQRALRLLGFGEQERPRTLRALLDRIPPGEAERIELLLFKRAAEGGGALSFDCRVMSANGQTLDFRVSALIHANSSGMATDMVGVLLDVTDDRQVRRELEQHRLRLGELVAEQTKMAFDARDKAHAAGAVKNEFLANMSHELRTPLHAIIGFSQLGLDEGEELELEVAAKYLQRVNASARRLLHLVDELLDLSRLDAGTFVLRRERQQLGLLIQTVADELAPLSAVHDVHFVLNCEPELVVEVDAVRFSQVLRNLMMNAIKYSPPAGRIWVQAGHNDARALRIDVRDEGEGIPVDMLESIFDRFRQAKNAVRKDGAGLGLAIAREITQLHQGRLWASNHPDGGAQFHIEVPLDPPTQDGLRVVV